MDPTLSLSSDTRSTAGILLLTVVAVEWGGLFMLRLVRGRQQATGFQITFYRAGHAHAGVLVILSLVGLILADGADLHGVLGFFARNFIWAAAILMPAGFFFSVASPRAERPNRLLALTWLGAVVLAAGVLTLGISLL
jgi:hypothetical protein